MEPVLTDAILIFSFLYGEPTIDRVALVYVEMLQVDSTEGFSILLLDLDLDGTTVYWCVELNGILQVHFSNDFTFCQVVLNRAERVVHHEEPRNWTRVNKFQNEMRFSLKRVLSADCTNDCEIVDTRVVQFHVN